MACGSQEHDREDGLAAVAYGPCEVRTQIRGVPVHVVEDTDYSFRGKVRMIVSPDIPHEFPLQLRIPGWAKGATVRVNGEEPIHADPGMFKRIEIDFPMQLRTSRWFNDSIAIERGQSFSLMGSARTG